MSPKFANEKNRLLTDLELELMTVIWELEKATVKEVLTHLPEDRAYTTVATVMKILEQKGFLKCQKDNYAHSFHPLVSKETYEKTCIDHMVTHVFDGEPLALVQRLLHAKKLSKHDIEQIEEALKKLSPSVRKKK